MNPVCFILWIFFALKKKKEKHLIVIYTQKSISPAMLNIEWKKQPSVVQTQQAFLPGHVWPYITSTEYSRGWQLPATKQGAAGLACCPQNALWGSALLGFPSSGHGVGSAALLRAPGSRGLAGKSREHGYTIMCAHVYRCTYNFMCVNMATRIYLQCKCLISLEWWSGKCLLFIFFFHIIAVIDHISSLYVCVCIYG